MFIEPPVKILINDPQFAGLKLAEIGMTSVKLYPTMDLANESTQLMAFISYEKYWRLTESLKDMMIYTTNGNGD